jgi:predicted transcriptional regulator
MPETIDTAKEIVNIKHDIRDVKQSQEADMHLNRAEYEELVSRALSGNLVRVKVFLEIDGVKSRKEVQDSVGEIQSTVWRAIDHLESHGLIFALEQTKGGSPVYDKMRWVKTLRLDDYVKKTFPIQTTKAPKDQPQLGNSNSQPVA